MMVSKAVLYEPVKELCDKFPAWMLANASVTAPADLERYNVLLAASFSGTCRLRVSPLTPPRPFRYRMQHQMLQEILSRFDGAKTPAEDAAVQERVLDIMQHMQEYGQPPRELMAELAPNMFFNDQGADAAAAGGAAGAPPKDLEGCPVQ